MYVRMCLFVCLFVVFFSYHLVNKTWNAYLFLEDDPAVATPSQPGTAGNTTFANSSVFSNTSSPPVEPVPTNPSPRYGHSAVVYEVRTYAHIVRLRLRKLI